MGAEPWPFPPHRGIKPSPLGLDRGLPHNGTGKNKELVLGAVSVCAYVWLGRGGQTHSHGSEATGGQWGAAMVVTHTHTYTHKHTHIPHTHTHVGSVLQHSSVSGAGLA